MAAGGSAPPVRPEMSLAVASDTMNPNASQRMRVVRIWRYLVFCTLQKTNGPTTVMKAARAIL